MLSSQGGASGIGAEIATQFLEAGATVYSTDLVESSPVGVKALVGDVSKEADILRLLGKAAAINGHIDILVNNAAIQPLGIPFAELTEDLVVCPT